MNRKLNWIINCIVSIIIVADWIRIVDIDIENTHTTE